MDSKELKNIIPIQSIWEDLALLEDRLNEVSSSSDPVSYTHLTLPTKA